MTFKQSKSSKTVKIPARQKRLVAANNARICEDKRLQQDISRQQTIRKVHMVLLKLRLNQLRACSCSHTYFELLARTLKLMRLSSFQINRFLYSITLKNDLLENFSTSRAQDDIKLIVYKVILNLHQRFANLLEQSVMDILNPFHEARLRFLNMLSWFNYYLEVNQEFSCSRISKGSGTFRLQANYIKCSESIHDFIYNCVAIRFNHHRFLTPPNIPLVNWRSFKFNQFFQRFVERQELHDKPIKLKTGFPSMVTSKDPDKEEFLKLQEIVFDQEPLSVNRVNRFLQNLFLISGVKVEPINDTKELADLKTKLAVYFPNYLQQSNEFQPYEIQLLAFWLENHQMDFTKYQQFENVVPLLLTNKFKGIAKMSPSIMFPQFYQFLTQNEIEFPVNKSMGKGSHINTHEESSRIICEFYKRAFLNDLVFHDIEKNELNEMIICFLYETKSEVQEMIKNTISYYLRVHYSGNPNDFDVYYRINASNSKVSSTIKAKFIDIMINPNYEVGNIKFPDLLQLHKKFHNVLEFYYSVYYPTLNWVYRDITTP